MNNSESIVFIVDDDKHSRDSVRAMVVTMNMKALTFSSAEEFLEFYHGEAGCLVTDLRMPGRSAIELLRELRERDYLLPTIIMTAFAEVPVAVEAMQQGAITLLEKPYRQNELWDAIREALRQDAELRATGEERRTIRQRLKLLTEGERTVMELVVDGIPNKAIATRLHISVRTVEARRQTILEKMKVDSVARLVQEVMIANDGHRPSKPSDQD